MCLLSTADGSKKIVNHYCTLSRIVPVPAYHPYRTHTASHCTVYRSNARSSRIPSLESPHADNKSFYTILGILIAGYGMDTEGSENQYGTEDPWDVGAAAVGVQ